MSVVKNKYEYFELGEYTYTINAYYDFEAAPANYMNITDIHFKNDDDFKTDQQKSYKIFVKIKKITKSNVWVELYCNCNSKVLNFKGKKTIYGDVGEYINLNYCFRLYFNELKI